MIDYDDLWSTIKIKPTEPTPVPAPAKESLLLPPDPNRECYLCYSSVAADARLAVSKVHVHKYCAWTLLGIRE